MPDLLTVALGIALGFLLGAIFGTRRTVRLYLQARRLREANATISRFMPDAPPTRSAADIIAGRIPVEFGGTTFILPTLAMDDEAKWLAELDGSFATLVLAMEAAGNNAEQIIALLVKQEERLLDALLDYDKTHVLPPRDEIRRLASKAQLLYAVLEVWRAANPLADTAVKAANAMTSTTPAPSSSSPTPTAGDLTTSSVSPQSRSSSTSTPPKSEPKPPPPSASRSRSKPSASDTSSPATGRHTTAGTTALASPAPRGRA